MISRGYGRTSDVEWVSRLDFLYLSFTAVIPHGLCALALLKPWTLDILSHVHCTHSVHDRPTPLPTVHPPSLLLAPSSYNPLPFHHANPNATASR